MFKCRLCNYEMCADFNEREFHQAYNLKIEYMHDWLLNIMQAADF